jgi:hypothetical protein
MTTDRTGLVVAMLAQSLAPAVRSGLLDAVAV